MNEAVELIQATPSSALILRKLLREPNADIIKHIMPDGTLRAGTIAMSVRMALEMLHHEDDERRALQGELHELENRWKQAEEIAAIADLLTFTAVAAHKLEILRATKNPEA